MLVLDVCRRTRRFPSGDLNMMVLSLETLSSSSVIQYQLRDRLKIMFEEKSEVLARHREECASANKLLKEAMSFYEIDIKKTTKMLKRVKAVVEAMAVRQNAERLACGLDDPIDLVQLAKKVKAKRILQGKWRAET